MEKNNVLRCFAEQIIGYIDARLAGDLEEAFRIKRRILDIKPAESMICHICGKCSNKGRIIVDNGKLLFECISCVNSEIIRKTTLFPNSHDRREGN